MHLPSPKSWLVLPLSLSVSSLWRHFGRRMVRERLSLRVTGARLWPKDCIRQFMRAMKRKSPGPWRITSFASHVYRHLYLFFFFSLWAMSLTHTHRSHGSGVGKIKIFTALGSSTNTSSDAWEMLQFMPQWWAVNLLFAELKHLGRRTESYFSLCVFKISAMFFSHSPYLSNNYEQGCCLVHIFVFFVVALICQTRHSQL